VTLAAGEDEGEKDKFRATLNDLGRLSLFVWAGTIVLTIVWSILGNKSFLEAFIAASLLAAAGVVGQGVFGIGGGQMSWADPVTRAARRKDRDRESMQGALTPLGVSLVVAAQLLLVAFLMSYFARR
jgi:hypothetical protein